MDEKVSLYFEEHGHGTPVVLIHGFPLDHTIWNPLVPLLEGKARLILPDLRGYGKSPVTRGTYDMGLLADDIKEMLDGLNIRQAVLVGHSMGGYVSLAFARCYPERLLGLALVASQAAADTPERRQGRLQTAGEVERRGVKSLAKTMPEKLTTHPDLVEPLRQLILQANPAGVAGALKGMADREDMTRRLSEINVPTLIIAGAQDSLIPLEKSREMERLLPRGWLVEIPNAGHMPMMEAPEMVAEALFRLLEKIQ
ncbi:MAG: alpha/beta fold hydrolase [Anaerolineales bacterium]